MASSSPPASLFSDSGFDYSSNSAPLYYAIAAVSTACIVLLLYKTVVRRWCSEDQLIPGRRRRFLLPPFGEAANSWVRKLIPARKYRKQEEEKGDSAGECSVCLSIFEEGDDIRQLPKCKHSFHVACIDMWLYSHSNCPLCRANLRLSPARPASWPERSGVAGLALGFV